MKINGGLLNEPLSGLLVYRLIMPLAERRTVARRSQKVRLFCSLDVILLSRFVIGCVFYGPTNQGF